MTRKGNAVWGQISQPLPSRPDSPQCRTLIRPPEALTHLFTFFLSFRPKLPATLLSYNSVSRSHAMRPLTSIHSSIPSLSYIQQQLNKGPHHNHHKPLCRYCRQYSCTISCAINSKSRYGRAFCSLIGRVQLEFPCIPS